VIHRLVMASVMVAATATTVLGEDRAQMNEASLVLVSDNTACRLVRLSEAGDVVLRLPLSGLCLFHRDDKGALRVMESPEGPIFLIESTRLLPENPQDCDTRVLAIRAAGDGLTPAPTPSRVAMCPPFQWDDVMFLGPF
jgi:hypothetical protein